MSRIPKMSARKLARFRSESAGAYPRSSITPSGKTGSKFYPAVKLLRAGNKTDAKIRKPIPSRKKRSTTPILSTPWPNALDSRSYVLNGRTVLYGKDLENLRRKVYIRAMGTCEARQHVYGCPLVVSWRDGELDHIKAKGSGGGWRDDTEENTRWLSSECHRKRHGQY